MYSESAIFIVCGESGACSIYAVYQSVSKGRTVLDHFKYRHYYEIFRDLIVMLRKNYFTEFQSVFMFVDVPFPHLSSEPLPWINIRVEATMKSKD